MKDSRILILITLLWIIIFNGYFLLNPQDQLFVYYPEVASYNEDTGLTVTTSDTPVYNFNIFNVGYLMVKILFFILIGYSLKTQYKYICDHSLYPKVKVRCKS